MRTCWSLLFLLSLLDSFACDVQAQWGTCSGPVGSNDQQLAFGRFRRRRLSPPPEITPVAPAVRVVEPKPTTTPAAEAPDVAKKMPAPARDVCRCPGKCACGSGCRCATDGPCSDNCWCAGDRLQVGKIEADDKKLNFGNDYKRPADAPERTTLNGEPIDKPQAIRVIEGSSPSSNIPDDAGWVRLTAMGTSAECKPLLDDLDHAMELKAVKDRCVLQVYDPKDKTAWAVTRYGFAGDGHPSIYVQSPAGQVLARMDHYPGPEVMGSVLAQAQRKADPSYDPKKDPDPTKPASPYGGLPVPLIVLGGGVLVALLMKPR